MTPELTVWVCIGGSLALVVYYLLRLFVRDRSARLAQRMREGPAAPAARTVAEPSPVGSLLRQVTKAAGKPFEPRTREEQSALRRRLGYAGIYSMSAMHLMSGARSFLIASGLLGGYFLGAMLGQPLLGLSLGGLLGYVLPATWLGLMIKGHRRKLEYALPDALDLLVICVESGLTLDSALQRVGREIALAHPSLARDLAITHMETQMGLPRADALRNLSRRTGSPAVQSLTAMLVQAEKMGTGIAQALRVHAESMRIKRQYAAEEIAAKASVKMTFPLVLCVFPALLIVVGGPAMILIMRHIVQK